MRFERKRTIMLIGWVVAYLVAHNVSQDSRAAHAIGWAPAFMIVYVFIFLAVVALLHWVTEEA